MIFCYALLGISTGMRTMTAMAVVCWLSWIGLLTASGWSAWSANPVSAIVFSVLALGEYYGDTLPQTPARTKLPLLVARLAFAALVGALAAHSISEPAAGGVIAAVVGALIGAYGGYQLRMRCARWCGRDLPVALWESALALALAVLGALLLHYGYPVDVV